MLPIFPSFKKLELSDKKDIEQITSQYSPYSDFNFLSMWSWDIKGEMQLSTLNENLVVRFTDYISGEPFYSFLGGNQANETAKDLLALSVKKKISDSLKLLPEVSVKQLDEKTFHIQEERNHFDYIYAIEKVKTYAGNKHSKHRNLVNSFTKKHKYESKILDLSEESNQKLIMELVDIWVKNKQVKAETKQEKLDLEEFKNEYLSLKRLFSVPKEYLESVVCFAVFVDGILSGFMVDERVSENYCISHFGKANILHKGNMQFLMQTSAKTFIDMGVNYYNDEQDLGLENLRSTKSSYELAHFLKKYTVSLHKE